MNNSIFRYVVVNFIFLGVFIAGLFYNIVLPFYKEDYTKITSVITVLMAINIVVGLLNIRSYKKNYEIFMDYCQFAFPLLGLVGTFIVFHQIFTGMNTTSNPTEVLALIKENVVTLSDTSIFGLVTLLWARLIIDLQVVE